MVHKRCFVSKCMPSKGEDEREHYFGVPKGLLAEWQAKIPHKPGMKQNSVFCHRHFPESSIKKHNVIQNQVFLLKTWRLETDVFPELHLGGDTGACATKSMEIVEMPRPSTLPEIRSTVQSDLLQPSLLAKISNKNVRNSHDAIKKPILANKTVPHLVKSSDFQTLQNVLPSIQKVTKLQPAATANSSKRPSINQPFQPSSPLKKRVNNSTASELQKVSTTQHYIVKDATLPSSWFWQEGSLLDHEFICSKFKWLDENKFEYTKTAIINGDTRTLRFFVRGQQVFHENLKYQFLTKNELIDCLAFYDKIPECAAISDRQSLQISAPLNVQAKSSGGENRSENCLLLSTPNRNSCCNCKKKNETHLKKNEKKSNGSKKTYNILSSYQASSESSDTDLNVDENLQEAQIKSFHSYHSYEVMTSPPSLNNRLMEIGNGSKENDTNDYELAKRFLKNEKDRKIALQRKIDRKIKDLKESKDIARAILKAWKKLQTSQKLPELPKRPKRCHPLTHCNQCGRMIRTARMQLHLQIHGGFKPHNCEICGRAFGSKSSLRSHVRFNHLGVPKPQMCSVCGKTCASKKELEYHETTHTSKTPEKPFECSICDKKFRRKTHLIIHKRIHTGEKPYTCEVCGKSYSQRQALKSHLSRNHENVDPDGTIDPLIRKKKSTSTALKLHSCTICEKSYVEKRTLKMHMKKHHELGESDGPIDSISRTRSKKLIPSYRCEFCKKEFCRVLAFEQHRSTHTGIPAAIPCGQLNCDYTYSNLKQLKDHSVAHHPDKIFPCKLCEKVFFSDLNLSLHQAAHNPSLGFQCSYCPKKTTTMSSLLKHEKIHAREKMDQS